MNTHSLPLNHCQVHKLWASVNKTYSLLNVLALTTIFYYRVTFFLNKTNPKYHTNIPSWPWLILFLAELLLSFLWMLRQPVYWRPVTRTTFPERLPKDEELPGIDVFICTADLEREPTFEVMNTVISAMALDYPTQKLSVYLSDDGGASVTLKGVKEAWAFATWWLPFVKKYNVRPPCPLAYFQEPEMEYHKEFSEDRKIVKEKYDIFKQQVQTNNKGGEVDDDARSSAQNHPALIQVIDAKSIKNDVASVNSEHTEMPPLVYVAREKRQSHPHNFKAGAINVLLRVSSTLSNSPYILVLDCDMYCNDIISARQAMCFYLDPKISPSLGWVQYPQRFHNVNEADIYDSQMKNVLWQGADGLQGPVISGTNFYIKREALYGIDHVNNGNNLIDLRDSFGVSNELIKSISQNYKGVSRDVSSSLLQEAKFLASCTYEKDTKWGEEVGFRYGTIAEDVMTGFFLHSKGWISVYMSPTRPQFLGLATTNLNDLLTQSIRWYSGILGIGLSKHCPLIYSPSRMQLLYKMFSSWITLRSLELLPYLCLVIIPPLCFFNTVPLYPKVLDPLFVAFVFVMISSQAKNLYETYVMGGSVRRWLNEQSIWMIKFVTSHAYGALDCLMTKLKIREASFIPTNKARDDDDDKAKYYHLGKYDFRTSNMFLVPIVTLVTFNLVCFVGGLVRVMISRNWDIMFLQLVLSLYLLVINFPVIEGIMLRIDDGRVPLSTTLISIVVSVVLLVLGYFSI